MAAVLLLVSNTKLKMHFERQISSWRCHICKLHCFRAFLCDLKLILEAENLYFTLFFYVPTTAAPSSPSSSSSPISSSFLLPASTQSLLLLRIFWMVKSPLTQRSYSPLGGNKRTGEITVMTGLPFSRMGLWGHKCGSARGCPGLCSLTGSSLTATVLPWSQGFVEATQSCVFPPL